MKHKIHQESKRIALWLTQAWKKDSNALEITCHLTELIFSFLFVQFEFLFAMLSQAHYFQFFQHVILMATLKNQGNLEVSSCLSESDNICFC